MLIPGRGGGGEQGKGSVDERSLLTQLNLQHFSTRDAT